MGDSLPLAPRRPRSRAGLLGRALAVLLLAGSGLLAVAGPASAADVVIVNTSESGPSRAGAQHSFAVALAGADCVGANVTFAISGDSAEVAATSDCIATASLTLPKPSSCPSAGATVEWTARIAEGSVRDTVAVTCPPKPDPTPTKTPKPTPTPTPTPTPSPTPTPVPSPTPTPTPSESSESPTPTPSATPSLTPATVTVGLAPLVPLDDGGPQPPTGSRASGLMFGLGGLALLGLGVVVAAVLWHRGRSRQLVGGVVVATLLLVSGVLMLPVLLEDDPAPSTSVRLRPTSVVTEIAAGESGRAVAQCPAGSVLVGGGARTSTPTGASDLADIRLTTSNPTADGWEAEATAPAGGEITLTALALCTTDRGVKATVVTSTPVTMPALNAERAQARCSSGHPLAVGWDNGLGETKAVAVLPLAEGASVTSWAGETDASTTVALLCATDASSAHVVRYDGTAVQIEPDGVDSAYATCPAGSGSVGGGYVAAGSDGGRITRVAVLSAVPSTDRYQVTVAATPGGGGVLLTAYALCVPTV